MAKKCRIKVGNDGQIKSVASENGNDSELFKGLNTLTNDPNKSLELYAISETEEFKEIFTVKKNIQKVKTLAKITKAFSDAQIEETTSEVTVESLRADEQLELQKAFPSIEGKVERENLSESDKVKYDNIYDKYDNLITPLLNNSNEEISSNNIEEPMLEGIPANRNEDQGGQESAELRTQESLNEQVILPDTIKSKVFTPVNDDIKIISEEYKEGKNLSTNSGEKIYQIDKENSKRIADAYDDMLNEPENPEVIASYQAMATETVEQYDLLISNGYIFEFFESDGEPYGSSKEMLKDLQDNKHLYILSTEKDFGIAGITAQQRKESALLADSNRKDLNGNTLLINDIFRGIHDAFGHGERGNSFGAIGEENAWDVHSRMYSPLARRAMTSETRGQNSWVNFGKHLRNEDGTIKKIPAKDKPFADQKIGLLPEWVSNLLPAKLLTGGASFSKFFAKITNTKDGGAKFNVIEEILQKPFEGYEEELAAYLRYGKNFQKHIMASIPGFVDSRIRVLKGMVDVAVMLGQEGKEVAMLDITSSEGYFTKAFAQLAQDKGVNATADALDAGVTFERDFNEAPQVEGVKYLLNSWGDSFVDPDSGITIPSFKATKKYGLVYEGMGFQFFSATREQEIAEVKSMMDENGMFVTMEKLKNPDYKKREILKDEYKSQFFSQEEMAQKAATVLTKSEESSVGMMDYQYDRLEYEKVLAKNFKYVIQFYSSGNFSGYLASDNRDVIQKALDSTGDTTTKFNEEVTPRNIQGDIKVPNFSEASVTPENSSNYANMTEDGQGNFVFYHTGKRGYETINPGTGDSVITSKTEAAAIRKVGGMAMYYTRDERGEAVVTGDTRYAVKVAKGKVYDFNNDPLNLLVEAQERHSKENPNKAFDFNSQLAYITLIAGEKGFDMVVSRWDGNDTRAQTTKKLKPDDIQLLESNQIIKDFDNKYVSNIQKGFTPVVPQEKQELFDEAYEVINKERNKTSTYDDLYSLYSDYRNYTQEEITQKISNSNLSQESKDKYQEALDYIQESPRSSLSLMANSANKLENKANSLKPKYYTSPGSPAPKRNTIFNSDKVEKQYKNVTLPLDMEGDLKDAVTELNKVGKGVNIVGGAVRDALQGISPKDIDFEVYGVSKETLISTLSKYGKVREQGESFGVIVLKTSDTKEEYEFAIPRKDNKSGVGYKGFEVELNPNFSLEEASRRRDFTWNSMSYNPITKTLFDPYNGLTDLQNGVIRHVDSQTFSEDPLRILRAMQFQARMGHVIAEETLELMRTIVDNGEIELLSQSRFLSEWRKWALKGNSLSLIFSFLRDTNLNKVFPDFNQLKTTAQDAIYHPEGDVEEHTMQVLSRAVEIAEREKLDDNQKEILIFSALLHDIAKPETTERVFDVKLGRDKITSRGHEAKGVLPAIKFLEKIGVSKNNQDIIGQIIKEHLAHASISSIDNEKGKKSAFAKLVDRLRPASVEQLVLLMEADMLGRDNKDISTPLTIAEFSRLLEEYKAENKGQLKYVPILTGNHLIKLGMKPGAELGEILKRAKEAQLEGDIKDELEALEWVGINYKNLKSPIKIVQEDGNYAARLGDNVAGRIRTKPYKNGLRVDTVLVKDAFKNQGLATSLYRAMIIDMTAKGITIYSDDSRAEYAERIWAKLESQGIAKKVGNRYVVGEESNEPNPKELFEYINSTNIGELNREEIVEVKNSMLGFNIKSSKVLFEKLYNTLANSNGIITFNEGKLKSSGLYNSFEIARIISSTVIQKNIKDTLLKLKNTEDINIEFDSKFVTPKSKKITLLGKVEQSNPFEVEREIAMTVAGLEQEQVQENLDQGIAEKYAEETELKDSIDNIAKNTRVTQIKIVSNDQIIDKTEDLSTYLADIIIKENNPELYEEIDFLELGIEIEEWDNEIRQIEDILYNIKDLAVNNGIDLRDFPTKAISMSREDIIVFLRSLENTINDPSQANISVFSKMYNQLFDFNSPIMELLTTNSEYDQIVESEMSEYELFKNFGLVKVNENVYRKVTEQNLEELYQNFFANKDINIQITDSAIETIEDLKSYVQKNLDKLGIEDFNLNTDLLEQIFLYKSHFGFDIKASTTPLNTDNLEKVTLSQEYLLGDFVKDFNFFILSTNNKYFTVNDKGIILTSSDPISLSEAIATLPEDLIEPLTQYSFISNNLNLGLESNDISYETFDDNKSKRDSVINNPQTIEKLKGEYVYLDGGVLAVKNENNSFVRTPNGVFEMVYESNNIKFYGVLPNKNTKYKTINAEKPLSDTDFSKYSYLETSPELFKVAKNYYGSIELEQINKDYFACNI